MYATQAPSEPSATVMGRYWTPGSSNTLAPLPSWGLPPES